MQLNHALVITHDLPSLEEFLINVVGLTKGYRPPFPFHGAWFYVDDIPVIHVAVGSEPHSVKLNHDKLNTTSEDSNYNQLKDSLANTQQKIDHIAFTGANYDELLVRIKKYNAMYDIAMVPISGEKQVFVFSPCGLKIEFTFKLQ